MHILLLAGGSSGEHDVSLRSGQAVAEALDELGHTYDLVDPGALDFNLVDHLNGADLVFPALHGAGGEDGTLQKVLEDAGIKFVGSGSASSELCFNKWAYKQLLLTNELPASTGKLVDKNGLDDEWFASPHVLKPIDGGSSLDTQIVRLPNKQTLEAAAALLERYGQMLLEPIIEGTEITVGILGEDALPVIEIIPPDGLEFDYENKYNGATQELCPPVNVSQDIQTKAKELALKIHGLCGCKDMSRTDMMIDKSGNLHVLETNTIPGLTNQSLLPKMAAQAGYSMADFVDRLTKLALAD